MLCNVSGNVNTILGLSLSAGTVVFTLGSYGTSIPVASDKNTVVDTTKASAPINQDGSFSLQVHGNDTITPINTVYLVEFFTPVGRFGPFEYTITGTSFNLNNAAFIVPGGTASSSAGKPAVADAILYVTKEGSDSNDGLSWGSSKATIQAALNALPATGGAIFLAAGTYNIGTTITAPSTNGPIYHIIGTCPATRDDNSAGSDKLIVINYTGSGNAIQSNAFASIQNLYLIGPSTTGTSVGIDCNGNGTTFRDVNVSGFGTGWFLDTGCFLITYIGGSIHDNGTNIGTAVTPTHAGESITFINCLISDNAANLNATSVNFTTSPGALDIRFINCSLDGVGVNLGSPGNFSFIGCHIEISNSGTHAIPFQTTHNQCSVSFIGCRALQDAGSTTAAQFILNNANLGNVISIIGGSWSQGPTSMTNIVANQTGDPLSKLVLAGVNTDITTRQSGTWAQVTDLDAGTINNSEIMVETGTGFGNGAAATAVTTTLKGTGTGPTTPQTVVNYVSIDVAGTKFWIPLVQ